MTKYMESKIRSLCDRAGQRCSVLNYAKHVERDLGRVCRKVWTGHNPRKQEFIFASYQGEGDSIIVTLAARHHFLNKFLPEQLGC